MARFVQLVRRGRSLPTLILAVSLMFVACKTGQAKQDSVDLESREPIGADSDDGRERLEKARQLLEEGEYDEARESLRLIQADYEGEAVGEAAELYLGRAALGDVALMEGRPDARGDATEAMRIFEPLAESAGVDKRVRAGATLYFGLSQAIAGDLEAALATLREYPDGSLGEVVLDADRTASYTLLVEAFERSDRPEEVIAAAARLYDELVAEQERKERDTEGRDDRRERTDRQGEKTLAREDAKVPERFEGVAALVRERAFEASARLGDDALEETLGSEYDLARAVAGWGILERRLDEGLGESDAEREELEDLFNRTAPYMVEVRASERAAEMSMRLAAAGGPKRLAIGFLLPLSGSSAAIGERLMAGALVAMRAFYDAGDPQVTLVFEDSQGDASEAFERLVDHDVLAVVGPVDRKRAKRFAPLAMEAELPLITLTTESVRAVLGDDQAADSEDADGRDDDRSRDDTDEPDGEKGESAEGEDDADTYVFRNFIDAAAEARAVARIAFDEIGDRRAAIVKPDIGYGEVTARAFRDEFEELGGRIVTEVDYDRDRTDFSDVASRVADADPEAVFLPDSAEKVAEVTSFFANENIWGIAPDRKRPARAQRTLVHYLGTSLWEHPMLVRQASNYVEGAAIPVWFSSAVEDEMVRRFVERFEAIYERKPENFEAFSYDTVSWLRALMLERGMRRSSAIRDGLLAGDVHQGVTGRAQMTERAEAARSLRFVTPTDEGFETLPFSGAAIRREEDDERPDGGGLSPSESTDSPSPRGGTR